MDKTKGKVDKKKNGFTNGLTKEIKASIFEWQENITEIELCDRNLTILNENIHFPPRLLDLKLCRNRFAEVPKVVLKMRSLRTLDLSYNNINYFNDTPSFCHTVESLNLANNKLLIPPYWVWSEKPMKLTKLNLSGNVDITKSFNKDCYEEYLQYNTLVTEIDICNCRLIKHLGIMATFLRAETIKLGTSEYYTTSNFVESFPCEGLDKCCDIVKLDLSNTHIYNVMPNIDIYKKLKEIDLSQNHISSLPNEFCLLENLEICILSYNKLLYLPENMCKLHKLNKLYLQGNELCMLPENLTELSNLYTLDLYDNHLYEVLIIVDNIQELDFAQNYFDEPTHDEYIKKREKLRLDVFDRYDGRKVELIKSESVYSRDITDDEELYSQTSECYGDDGKITLDLPGNDGSSSSEDWDSDEYWIPRPCRKSTPPPHSPWLYYVKRKMEEGNFCPMDAHAIPISEKVRYERMCNPKIVYESDGQFDDYSDDES